VSDRGDRPAASDGQVRRDDAPVRLHASCVALEGRGVMLLGPSGSGKSDLAIRLIDLGARLVADDQLLVERSNGRLLGRPEASLAGLVEARGIGLLRLPFCACSPIDLVVELDRAERIPRWPERAAYPLLGLEVACLRLDPRAASAPAVIRLALVAERLT
jgi:HPr kinase/phosphorylase